MENKSVEISDETVTLLLRRSRIVANKVKLANYSHYFASLFSENFNDHHQNEFRINYDVSLETLRTFVNWINDEDEDTRLTHSEKYFFHVRASLKKFLTGYYSELLELLDLSVIFTTEKLTDNIVQMIIHNKRLPPRNMLKTWVLAENIGLKVLGNIVLAKCLDRFDELPLTLLLRLPVENFFKLVLNVNVRTTTDWLLTVREQYKKCNDVPKDLPDSYLQFLNGDPDHVKMILDSKRPHYVQCVAGYKSDESLDIWSWNGEILQELTEMTDSQMHTTFEDNGREITGRQVVGRGFDIYLIGGEQGIGTGRFNTALWRYCSFSKKWYIETVLPRPRRHMAVAFIENYLFLFGGVGRHRCKLSSVDVFNVHTGKWSVGRDVPEQFTDVPPSCVGDNKFIYYKSYYHIYDPFLNTWSSCVSEEGDEASMEYDVSNLLGDSAVPDEPIISLLGIGKSNNVDTSVVYRATVERNTKKTLIRKDCITWADKLAFPSPIVHAWMPEDGPGVFDHQILNWPYLVSFAHSEGRATIEVGELQRNDGSESSSLSVDSAGSCALPPALYHIQSESETYRRLKIHSRDLTNAAIDCFKHRLGCFNLIDPESLHNLIHLTEQASISV